MYFTIFTPTYNRAYILKQAYESLKNQDFKDFQWLILDDGSMDDTEQLIQQWQSIGDIRITYVKQSNQGRFAAYNHAKLYFEGELVVALDSDDYLLPNALSKIYDLWTNCPEKNSLSGIVAYIENENHVIIGNEFPKGIFKERVYVLYDKYNLKGDKFQIYRVDLAKKYDYPIYKDEKFTGDNIVFNYINDEFPMLVFNEKLCHREYIDDGLTKNLYNHHAKSPNGMADYYFNLISREKYNKLNILKHCIGYVCFSKFALRKSIIRKSPKKIMTVIAYFPGLMLLYVRYKNEFNTYKKSIHNM